MRGDLPEAAVRLLCDLPVRTHERYMPEQRSYEREYRRRTPEQRGDATRCRPLTYKGRSFKSITEAKKKLHVSPKTLYRLLDTGEATYL